MSRDPRYDVLFEPVPLGPVTARNRFFQVPHCNGMGHRDPTAHAVMRGVKAEGGWAVVCTEEVEIHPTSDTGGFIEGRLWDDADIPAHERLVEQVHAHGSLAGIEFVHNGMASANLYGGSRRSGLEPAGPRQRADPGAGDEPRGRRRPPPPAPAGGAAVAAGGLRPRLRLRRARALTLQHFLSRRYNLRDDEYGGTLENRARLLREVLEDTLEECDGRAAVACRVVVDELLGEEGIERPEIEQLFELVGELPDLWDVMVGFWPDDSRTSRFAHEAWTEEHFRGIKQLTSKPVVGIGWLTSPDTMVRLIRDGVVDLIGAGSSLDRRPVPAAEDRGGPARGHPRVHRLQRLRHGRLDDDANSLHAEPVDGRGVAARLAPERFRPAGSDSKVLVVGGGPAGLEAAMALGKRGYEVVLAEAGRELGGRVLREARLPGLAAWIRVVDYRRASSQSSRTSSSRSRARSPRTRCATTASTTLP
jgi:NADH:flavin oxidoreductases, Old Yellow Enzyme family